jgi:hypothetical protein
MNDTSEKPALLASTMASAHLSTRREPRYQMHFEIEVCGIGTDTQPFRLRTLTLDVSEWGCRFALTSRMDKNAVFTVQVVRDEQGHQVKCPTVIFQMVRMLEFKGRFEIAAWKLAPEKVWPVDFPAASPEQPNEESENLRK